MGKNNNFIIGLLLILLCNYRSVPCFGVTPVSEVYNTQIGVREKTGHNDGKDVEKYLKTVGLGKGYSWCAAFVKWCLLEAGYIQANAINGMALTCHRKGHIVYEKGKVIREIQQGDVGTLYYPNLGRIGHTFFYDKKVNEKIYRTVEGNTNAQNSREGDGVYVRYRSIKQTFSFSRWTE